MKCNNNNKKIQTIEGRNREKEEGKSDYIAMQKKAIIKSETYMNGSLKHSVCVCLSAHTLVFPVCLAACVKLFNKVRFINFAFSWFSGA